MMSFARVFPASDTHHSIYQIANTAEGVDEYQTPPSVTCGPKSVREKSIIRMYGELSSAVAS